MVSRPVLLYDSDCRFCRYVARTFVRLDRDQRMAFLPLADPEVRALLPDLTNEQRMASIHLVEPDGRRFSRGVALAHLLRDIGLPALPAALLARAYGPVARRRDILGRLVPDRPAPRRYP